MAKQKLIKLKEKSIRIAVLAFAIFLLSAAAAGLGLFDISNSEFLILSVASIAIIYTEIGLVKIFGKGGGLDFFSALGIFSGLIILITLILDFFPLGDIASILQPIRGFVFLVMGISFFIETFVR